MQEWSIQEIARSAGTTSRTLRHYGDIGLLEPSRVGHNGYRYYDLNALMRLQRILLLRDLGLGLPAIGEVLDGERDSVSALRTHLTWLERERERIGRQIESVKTTLHKMEGGEQVMASEAFDGFDHTQYKDEVIERWGREAYEQGDRWWKSMSDADKQAFQQEQVDIAKDFAEARKAGKTAGSDEVQAITQRQYDWITIGWQGNRPGAAQFAGLGQMYVDDPAVHGDLRPPRRRHGGVHPGRDEGLRRAEARLAAIWKRMAVVERSTNGHLEANGRCSTDQGPGGAADLPGPRHAPSRIWRNIGLTLETPIRC